MKNIISTLLVFTILVLTACKKNPTEPPVPASPNPQDTAVNYTSDHKYNVNIIYFIPTDNPAVPNYESRLSAVLLQGQEFYKTWMNKQGFGEKTFGLLADKTKGKVKIITIKGKFPMLQYVSGKHDNIAKEINEYFTAHPSEKSSEHTLVIQPIHTLEEGLPYYGTGRWAYICDLPELNVNLLGTSGEGGTKATTYIGGLLHELGHALNLPHDKEKVSEAANSNFGTSLMGSGNYTYGKSPTFISASACAILSNCQVFSTTEKEFYKAATVNLKNISTEYKNGNILISGKFLSDIPVSDVGFYNDPAEGDDYDAVTWTSKVINNENFSIIMPISELQKKGNTTYSLRVRFYHTNGSITTFSFAYVFKDGIPVVDFGLKAIQYDKTNWSVIDYSTNETVGEDGKAANVLDNDLSTSWLSRWSSAPGTHPHFITIDMKQLLVVKGFTIAMDAKYETRSKDVEILSGNDGSNWSSLGNYVLSQQPGPQHIYLPAAITTRYFKVVIKSSWNGNTAANISEISAFNE